MRGFRAARVPAPEDQERPEIVRRAEALGIPWEAILHDEIQAEQSLRRLVADPDVEIPLGSATTALPASFLSSWRVRERIQSLAGEARSACSPSAIRELRLVSRRLIGLPEREGRTLAVHLWHAYQRILLLARVCRAAERSRGTGAERVAQVCESARCGFDDAAWAIAFEEAPRHGHRLDAVVRKVRDEGFQIPRERTEAKAFASLRRTVRRSRHLAEKRPRSRRYPVAQPLRVPLPPSP